MSSIEHATVRNRAPVQISVMGYAWAASVALAISVNPAKAIDCMDGTSQVRGLEEREHRKAHEVLVHAIKSSVRK
jgi:hypothetical protein